MREKFTRSSITGKIPTLISNGKAMNILYCSNCRGFCCEARDHTSVSFPVRHGLGLKHRCACCDTGTISNYVVWYRTIRSDWQIKAVYDNLIDAQRFADNLKHVTSFEVKVLTRGEKP